MPSRMKISAVTEKLARAMCEAVGEDPDEAFSHGDDWRLYPRTNEGSYGSCVMLYSERWKKFAWPARRFIFEHTARDPELSTD